MEANEPSPARLASAIELSFGSWRLTLGRSLPALPDIARLYDQSAWRWHPCLGLLGYAGAYARLFESLAGDGWLNGLGAQARVLDGGIGTGALSAALARAVPGAVEIHGVDISPRMLAWARRHLGCLRRPELKLELRHGDIGGLHYAAGKFDLVMSAHAIEHSRTPWQTVAEMARVLRGGAPLLLVTTRQRRGRALHALRWRYRALDAPQLAQWMTEAGLCDIRRYALDAKWSLAGQGSVAYIGRKPSA